MRGCEAMRASEETTHSSNRMSSIPIQRLKVIYEVLQPSTTPSPLVRLLLRSSSSAQSLVPQQHGRETREQAKPDRVTPLTLVDSNPISVDSSLVNTDRSFRFVSGLLVFVSRCKAKKGNRLIRKPSRMKFGRESDPEVIMTPTVNHRPFPSGCGRRKGCAPRSG
jgi:hypothetical protein